MNRLLAFTFILGLASGVVACGDDFLTTIPTDRISDATFWQTEQDFEFAVNSAYNQVIALDQMYIDGATDLAYSQQYWMRNSPYAEGEHDALTGWHSGIWARIYAGLAKANEVLAQLEGTEVDLDPTFRDEIEGQARFLRGYYYHELLWLFGGVPLLTEVPTPEEAREASRATRSEVHAQVMADLQAAAGLLPTSWPGSEYGRATRGAALGYMARAALYEASYQKYAEGNTTEADRLFGIARDAAQSVMDLGVYSLHPDFREMFTNAGEGNSGVIFDYQIVSGQNGWWAWVGFAPSSMGGNADLTPTRALVDKFYMDNGLPIDDPASGYDPSPPVITYDAGGNPTVVSLGMYANRDPRLYGTVLFPGASFNGTIYNTFPDSPTADRLDQGNFFNTHTGFMGLKYVDPVDQSNPWQSGLNMIKLRYADILLMYAEAKVELGEIDGSASAAFNEVRARPSVNMPAIDFSAMSAQERMDLIQNERAVEFAWEGLRLADIRRWRIAETVMPGDVFGIDYDDGSGNIVTVSAALNTPRLFTAPRDYLWPIPASELDLTDFQQNPGY
ncbi:MAG: RagB/SusD family nutrient uptake outer membrane protein [Longimicrobiales bacterium]|nr:RagB/SusD family nutrient uptake outer membrane protein [Longimicrobiales bacterium]